MTKAERAYVDLVKRSGCGCCITRGYEPDPDNPPMVEGHHHTEGGIRLGHLHVEGLCAWHHRGQLFVEGWDHAEHRLRLGPNLRDEGKRFATIFGHDACRLRIQRARLGLPE